MPTKQTKGSNYHPGLENTQLGVVDHTLSDDQNVNAQTAITNGDADALKAAISAGATIDSDILIDAIDECDPACVQVLIGGGADVRGTPEDGWTPVGVAIDRANVDIVDIFIDLCLMDKIDMTLPCGEDPKGNVLRVTQKVIEGDRLPIEIYERVWTAYMRQIKNTGKVADTKWDGVIDPSKQYGA